MAELLAEVHGPFVYDKATMSLRVSRAVTYEEWAQELGTMQAFWVFSRRELPWYLGDMLNYGEARWGETYTQAIMVTGLDADTLANYKSACRKFQAGVLRVAGLSIGHHEAVRTLPDAQQVKWLEAAKEQKWSRADLRGAVQAIKAQATEPTGNGTEPREAQAIYTLRLTWLELDAVFGAVIGQLDGVDAEALQDVTERLTQLWNRASEAEERAQEVAT